MDSPDWSAYREAATVAALATRIFSTAVPLAVERVPQGVSTRVYRLRRGAETFYLRVLPETGASFAPEVRVHQLLRDRGVRVPAVVYFEPCNERLRRSVMVTTEIPGRSLSEHPADPAIPRVLSEAGRQLALINTVPVDGFGWLRRDAACGDRLVGEHATQRAFATEHLEADLAAVTTALLAPDQVAAIRAVVDRHRAWLAAERAWLAHGDFDATPIFQRDGRYTGIIDFGEMRGADRWYDLGHFRLHEGERFPESLLPWLLAGYRSVAPLPDDADRRIAFASLLIGIRTLARTLMKRPTSPLVAHCLRAIGRDVASLAGG